VDIETPRTSWAAVVALCLVSCPGSNATRDGLDHGGWQPLDASVVSDRGPDRKITIIGSRCTSQGSILHEDATGFSGWFPRVTWSNDQYGVVWRQLASSSTAHAAFRRVGKDGQPVGATRMLTAQPTVTDGAGPQVAAAGLERGFAVVWADSRAAIDKSDLYHVQLDEAGAPLAAGAPCTAPGCGERRVTTSERAQSPYVVRPSYVDLETRPTTSLSVAWQDGRRRQPVPYPPYETGRSDVYYKVLNINGTDKAAERRVTSDTSRNAPGWPVMAYDGDHYAVAWRDSPSGGGDTEHYYVFLREDGTVVRPEQRLAAGSGLFASSPDIVWAAREFGIVFSSNPASGTGAIQFSRIRSDNGAILGVQKLTVRDLPCTPAVAYNGERYAVVWQDRCGQEGSKLVFGLVDDSGSLLTPDGKSCYGSADPACGLRDVYPDAAGTAAFPSMISVNGELAVVWMNAPKKRIHVSRIVCTP
jgi:hypothetical protein